MAIPKQWGIRQQDLASLNSRTLEDLFYGMHNLAVPTPMLNLMNPEQILAKYVAAGVMKRANNHKVQSYPYDFHDLVEKMDEIGARSLLPISGKALQPHKPATPFYQKARLIALDEAVRQEFVDSFHADYVPSNREEPSNPNAFYDPNTDANRANSGFYARAVHKYFASRWTNRKR